MLHPQNAHTFSYIMVSDYCLKKSAQQGPPFPCKTFINGLLVIERMNNHLYNLGLAM